MTILLYLGGFVAALLALAGLAVVFVMYAQAAGRVDVALRVRALDICESHKLAALAYFEFVSKQASLMRALWDHVRAPFVLWGPLHDLPWEAAYLPPELSYWDNNVSINGDGWGWQDADGNWHQCSEEPTPPGVTPVPYTSLEYQGDAYYAPGHHPRSFWARFVWLALRNVACKPLHDAGPMITERPILLAGAPISGATTPGFALFWNGRDGDEAAYQWHSIDKWLGPMVAWTNVGAKLGVPYSWPETMPCRAMLTGTWRAFKWGA